ncbi:MAG: GNAT family N-acetyltransferase, partial [Candidatus Methanofastidiosa archaeon]|nr:GNAT family N-acetyltransferase [Candidatus Methanofastidiosa archaeon]
MSKITITEIKEDSDMEEIISVYKSVFQGSASTFTEDWIKWKYYEFLDGRKSVLLVARNDEGRVIGIRGFIPFPFVDNEGNRYLGYQSVDSAIAKEYRGQGLFRKLNLRALE